MHQASNPPQSPKWANKLLEWFCPDELLEEIGGDLQEMFEERVEEVGVRQARREYGFAVLGYLRPFAFKRKTNHLSNLPFTDMIVNYLISAIRHFGRHKTVSFINVSGLSLSIAFCLLIFLFTKDEYSFDRFHNNAERIYRLHQEDYVSHRNSAVESKGWLQALSAKGQSKQIVLPPLIGPAIQEEIPEVAQTLRYQETSGYISYKHESFPEQIRFVDKNFFQFFSFSLLQGDAATVLKNTNSVVITPAIARKYFRNENPLGKTLAFQQYDKTSLLVVTGIAQQAPANSSIVFDILIPYENNPVLEKEEEHLRSYYNTITFIQLKEKVSLRSLQQNLNSFMNRHYGDQIEYQRKEKGLSPTQPVYRYGLTNITDTHFDNSTLYWPKQSNPQYAYILLTISGFIVLMACINYTSFALAGASARMQEIGIRKLIGARRRQVILQLWVETQLFVLLAILLALPLAVWAIPVFNYFTDKTLTLYLLLDPQLISALVGLAIVIGIVAGGYPALIISGFHPAGMLKSKFTYRINLWFSRILVVIQYSVCIFLVTGTLIVYEQMNYISGKELGYHTEQIGVVSNYAAHGDATLRVLNRLREQAATHPDILSVSATSSAYGRGSMSLGYQINGKDVFVRRFDIDHQFFSNLGMILTEGRNFSEAMGTEAETVIVNETLAALLGGSQIVGTIPKDLGIKVIGIVKDHHYESLENKIGPALYFYRPENSGYFLCKVSPGNLLQTITQLKEIWREIAPGHPFTYQFMDEVVAAQYNSYQKWSAIISSATLFAICIAALGLLGLTGIIAINRTKEIGIRKILGASVTQLFLLLNKGTLGLVLLSFVIAVPLAVYIMEDWLNNFAYRIHIAWHTFALTGLVSVLIAVLSVSFYSIKAAISNPVNSLRNE